MYLVLPNDKKNIGDTLEAMENVKDLDQDLSEANITISLPKFKIESS
jgi:serine protease inhibitor